MAKATPRASQLKKMVHFFYLVQPVLQFFLLVSIIGIFSRCSPLSPSADKGALAAKSILASKTATSSNADDLAQQQVIAANLKEVKMASSEFISQTAFQEFIASQNLRPTAKISQASAKQTAKQIKDSGTLLSSRKLMVLISKENFRKFLKDKNAVWNMGEFSASDLSDRSAFLKNLKLSQSNEMVSAKIFLVVADDTNLDEEQLSTQSIHSHQVSLALPNENSCVLELKLSPSVDTQEAIKAALQHVVQVAILLE